MRVALCLMVPVMVLTMFSADLPADNAADKPAEGERTEVQVFDGVVFTFDNPDKVSIEQKTMDEGHSLLIFRDRNWVCEMRMMVLREAGKITGDKVPEALHDYGQSLLRHSLETKVRVKKMIGKKHTFYYIQLTDRRKNLKAGRYITQGMVELPPYISQFKIVTKDRAPKEAAQIMDCLKSLEIKTGEA